MVKVSVVTDAYVNPQSNQQLKIDETLNYFVNWELIVNELKLSGSQLETSRTNNTVKVKCHSTLKESTVVLELDWESDLYVTFNPPHTPFHFHHAMIKNYSINYYCIDQLMGIWVS